MIKTKESPSRPGGLGVGFSQLKTWISQFFAFILMVSDQPGVVKEAKCLFADDLKLYLEIGNQEYCEKL